MLYLTHPIQVKENAMLDFIFLTIDDLPVLDLPLCPKQPHSKVKLYIRIGSKLPGISTFGKTAVVNLVSEGRRSTGGASGRTVAVVTGSYRPIGVAIAKSLVEQGANVVVNYVTDNAAADEVVQAIRSQGKGATIAVCADTSTLQGGQLLLNEAVKTFDKIDILVLNAGIMGSKTLADVDEAFFNSHFQY
ncbi:hypothetical protein Hypma_014544 [Hypsizygus marmoreus]|uniref:Versicolorin reductase n=1 Tax=Hypsizygus marmoreus TaxID=39966 RepID=A0A369JAC2_HYPMA|nr:hypothetical protein Hypma_014544 [Hypsizygus marmoreus]